MNTLGLFIRLSRPPLIIISVLLYSLGVGVARYLGVSINWGLYFLGQTWLLLVQFVVHAIDEYFELPKEQRHPGRTLLFGSTGVLELGKLPRPTALWASVACALAAALFTVFILQEVSDPQSSTVIMLVLVLVGLAYAVPPLRLSSTGYGELGLTLFVTAFMPVFAYTLQDGGIHRILAMITFPLICFFLTLLLICEFPDYASDMKYEKTDLLLRLGWQRAMTLHNLLVLGGFLFLALAVVFGFPVRLALPIITVLPIGLIQVWMLNRIRQGYKPNWNLMMVLASATFGLTAYFLAYGFWTH